MTWCCKGKEIFSELNGQYERCSYYPEGYLLDKGSPGARSLHGGTLLVKIEGEDTGSFLGGQWNR